MLSVVSLRKAHPLTKNEKSSDCSHTITTTTILRNHITLIFHLSFPNQGQLCFGRLARRQSNVISFTATPTPKSCGNNLSHSNTGASSRGDDSCPGCSAEKIIKIAGFLAFAPRSQWQSKRRNSRSIAVLR